jgi:3',5'-cyclic-AMP phosphodiesterase
MDYNKLSRRNFIYYNGAACLTLAIPSFAKAAVQRTTGLSLGLIADLHDDVIHNGMERLQTFINEVKKSKPNAIIQMGDFAYPDEKHKNVIDLFNNAHHSTLHVIGNHDTDSGHTHQQCIDIWGMSAAYYAKKVNDFWLIVLNGNEKGSPAYKGGYPAYIGPEQTQWLKQKLEEIKEPIIIVCHQPLIGWLSVDNCNEIQNIISSAKDRVLLVLNGHTHIDSLTYVNEIPFLTINSASYFWVGQKYIHESYPADILQSHEWISRTCPYRDSLFTTLTINPKKLIIELKGKESEWVGKSPTELGYTEPDLTDKQAIVPYIRQRKIDIPKDAVISLKQFT